MDVINLILLLLSDVFFLALFSFSIYEKEYRAALISSFFLFFFSIFWLFLISENSLPGVRTFNLIVLTAAGVFAVISPIKYFPKRRNSDLTGALRYDERDNMFSRMNMQDSFENTGKYYKINPGKEASDRKISKNPNIGDPGGKFFDRYYSPVANSAFKILDRTSNLKNGKIKKDNNPPDPAVVTGIIKKTAKYYGAIDVGITDIENLHLYSHHGRREHNWGKPVENTHPFGIVFVVGMDQEMIKRSPSLPVLLESSKQYVESAKIAHLIAEYIRELGYDAKSHVDGNYDILAVPMAKDAGLGEVGRMGILVHHKFGPAVRLSVVTTDIPLIKSDPRDDHIEEFCYICKKCAHNCPTGSVPGGAKPQERNFEHWSVDQQSCYSFWRKTGTDCAFCIRVCPYMKKDTLIHKLIRYYISRNPVNQRIALIMDDIFYGKRFTQATSNPAEIILP